MHDELERALATLASRGRDPDPATEWKRASERARRRRRKRNAVTIATTVVLFVGVGAFAIHDRGKPSSRVAAIGPPTTSGRVVPLANEISFTRGYTIWTTRPSASSVPRALTTRGCCSFSAWSPDHRLIAVTETGDIAILRGDGTVLRRLDAATVFTPSWSPDGRQIAFAASPPGGSNGGPIEIVDVDGRRPPRTIANVFAGRVAWSPDGTRIAFTSLDEPIHVDIVTIVTGKVARLTHRPGAEQWDPSWSAANGRIAFASDNGIDEVRADGRGLREIVASHRPCCQVNSPSWSPDGTKIVYGIEATGLQELIVIDVASGSQMQLTSGSNGGTSPAW